jgi:hypothetical protein
MCNKKRRLVRRIDHKVDKRVKHLPYTKKERFALKRALNIIRKKI